MECRIQKDAFHVRSYRCVAHSLFISFSKQQNESKFIVVLSIFNLVILKAFDHHNRCTYIIRRR